MGHKPKALLIAAFDSQLKWCSRIRDELSNRGFICRTVVPGVRSALSPEQIAAAGFEKVENLTWNEVMAVALSQDVVVSGLSGPLTRRFTFELSLTEHDGPMPILVTGWVGIIIEKLVAGYLDRLGCDVVAVNSMEDFERFKSVAERSGLPTDNLLLTGLPFLPPNAAPQKDGPIKRVLFADQPTVPESGEERAFLYEKMVSYAREHPDREVLLKPRHRPEEDTFHRMKHHPEGLLADIELPENFHIDYTPISEIIGTVDLLITMSSTACLEALAVGARVALPLDLGIHERYGNQVFQDAGMLKTFSQIERDDIGAPASDWVRSYFFGENTPAFQMIADRCEEFLASGDRPAADVWRTDYFMSARNAHFAVADIRERRKANSVAKDVPQGRKRYSPLRKLARATKPLVPPILIPPIRNSLKLAGLL